MLLTVVVDAVKVFVPFGHYSFDYAPSVLVGNYSCLLIYIILCLKVQSYALLCELKIDLSLS